MQTTHRHILGMRVDVTTYDAASKQVIEWARARESRYVCAANVHMAMEAYDSKEFQRVVNGADMVVPDGMPLVWALRTLGCDGAERVRGPALFEHVCRLAEAQGQAVGFYGSTPETLEVLIQNIRTRYPNLHIAYQYSPPFRPLTETEEEEIIREITASNASVLFVGLGCPKQERWMARHRDRLPAVMIGVGAAFDFHAGTQQEAPNWMQNMGLEWLFRLLKEPRRLWKRYLKHNPRFVLFFILQLCGRRGNNLT